MFARCRHEQTGSQNRQQHWQGVGEIYTAVEQLFEKTWPPGKRVRLVGVGVSGFEPPAYQLGLWEHGDVEQDYRLQSTLDELRDRFGDQAIQRGSQLKRNDSSDEG